MKIILKIVIAVCFLACFLVQAFGAYYLFHGSFEMFPTEERQDGVRSVSLFLIIMPLLAEAILIFIYSKFAGARNLKGLFRTTK